jgi:hypothetical protein
MTVAPRLLALLALCGVAMAATGPADNGRAQRPPQGWRHWNQWNGAISQDIIEGNMRGLADRSRLIDGKHASLADIGYNDAGIDDGWMKCGSYGPEKYRYHSGSGDPMIDGGKFPSMRELTDLAHSLNLTAGWYGNACGCAAQPYPQCCSDHCDTLECFAGDINATLAFGFDSYKLDGCGAQRDIELWAHMFNHSITQRRASNTTVRANPLGMMIENCHDDDGMTRGKETHLLRHFVPKIIVLPRQARDKHRENSKKDAFLQGMSPTMKTLRGSFGAPSTPTAPPGTRALPTVC